jgi:hypothetical protein
VTRVPFKTMAPATVLAVRAERTSVSCDPVLWCCYASHTVRDALLLTAVALGSNLGCQFAREMNHQAVIEIP